MFDYGDSFPGVEQVLVLFAVGDVRHQLVSGCDLHLPT